MAAKVRPALVFSVPFADKDYALFHVIPHTTAVRGSQFEVSVAVPWLETGVFNIQGSVSVPKPAFVRRLGALNSGQLELVAESMRRWLGL
jgi:mRNA interferase MazF